jgi:hypothetical protein
MNNEKRFIETFEYFLRGRSDIGVSIEDTDKVFIYTTQGGLKAIVNELNSFQPDWKGLPTFFEIYYSPEDPRPFSFLLTNLLKNRDIKLTSADLIHVETHGFNTNLFYEVRTEVEKTHQSFEEIRDHFLKIKESKL